MSVKSWTEALVKAAAKWDPSKHPRGRDGKFIEVGDLVAVFDGPSGPQIKTGKVKAGYFAPDGRMFIGVDSGDGKVEWYRPKQIEQVNAKATLEPPKQPLPDPGGKIDSIQWDSGPMAELTYTSQGVTFVAPPGAKVAFPDYAYAALTTDGQNVGGVALVESGGAYYAVKDTDGSLVEVDDPWYETGNEEKYPMLSQYIEGKQSGWVVATPDPPPTPPETEVVTLAESATPEAGPLPTEVKAPEVQTSVYPGPQPMYVQYVAPGGSGTEVAVPFDAKVVKHYVNPYGGEHVDAYLVAQGGDATSLPTSFVYKTSNGTWMGVQPDGTTFVVAGSHMDTITEDWADLKPESSVPDSIELPGDVEVFSPAGGYYPYILDSKGGVYHQVYAAYVKDGKAYGVMLDTGDVVELNSDELFESGFGEPGTSAWDWQKLTPSQTKAAHDQADVTAASKIKLPPGKSPADVVKMIKTSAENKGLDYNTIQTIDFLIEESLNAKDYNFGKKHLAKAMTLAKLGGKQRARYSAILGMHYGVHEKQAVYVAEPGVHGPTGGAFPKLLTSQPKGGGTKIMGLQPGMKWVHQHNDPQTAKAGVQAAIVDRMTSTTTEEFAAIFDSPRYSTSAEYKQLVKAWREFGVPGKQNPKFLRKVMGGWKVENDGSWGGAIPATKENLDRAVRETAIRDLIALWARTSNDNNCRSLAMQEAAKVEFGLTDTYEWPMQDSLKAQTAEEYNAYSPLFRRFLRAMYENTQDSLKAAGVTHVRLRRGTGMTGNYGWVKGTKRAVSLRPMSSFSASQGTASGFGGGVVLDAWVPVERIVGSARTGFGCQGEYEYVVLGGTDEFIRFK